MLESTDLWLLHAVYAGQWGTAWRNVVALVTFLGSGWMLFGLVPLFFVPTLRARAAVLLLTLVLTSGIVASVKVCSGRVRPCHALGLAGTIPVELPTDPSFPSGHAAGSFAFAAFVFATNRRAGVALAGLASAVALSRVALGVHYPSDVLAGAFVGAVIGWAGARASSPAGGSLANADSEPVRQ
jgi:undecaprenyl-diphosphatase